jgi:hypothetical protein
MSLSYSRGLLLALSVSSRIKLVLYLAIFLSEQAKSECDWMVMTSVFVSSQSGCAVSVGAKNFT